MEKDVFILRAFVAKKGSRYPETTSEVIDAVRHGVDIKKMPRSLLIESYANVMSELKLTLKELLHHQNSGVQNSNQVQVNVYNIIEVSDTIEAYSHAVLHLVDQYLLCIKDLDNESIIIYLNLRGDCLRNLAEILTKEENDLILNSALLAYDMAYDMAKDGMDALNPIRLQVALSYCNYSNDLIDDTETAYDIAAFAFTAAQAKLNKNTHEVIQHDILLQKLYDNMVQWTKILCFQDSIDLVLKFNPTFSIFEQIKRSVIVEKAMLSREMKRYNTMAATMKYLLETTNTINLQEGKLFYEAFQKLVDERRLSLGRVAQNLTLPNVTEDQKQITTKYMVNTARELHILCYTVLAVITRHILNNDLIIDRDTKIFFMNMKSKYFQYILEFSTSGELDLYQSYGDNVGKAYILAQEMQLTSDIRLEATINFAIYLADHKNESKTAYQICNTVLRQLGIHEKEVENHNIVPKMHHHMNMWGMKQRLQNKFSSLCELTIEDYTSNYLNLALIAESSERYLDMAVAVKNLIDVNRRLDFDERDIFNDAFKNLVDERRNSLDNLVDTENLIPVVKSKKVKKKNKFRLNTITQEFRDEIKFEMEFLCWYTIHLLNTLLSIDNIGIYSKVYYLRMKGDYYRYLTEICDTTRHANIHNALNAYKNAYEIAMDTMSPVFAYRLEVIVNYAAFLYDIMQDKRNAASMLRQALRDIGNKKLNKRVSNIVDKIKENLSVWFTSDVQKDSVPEKGGLQPKDNLPNKNDLQQKNDLLQNNAQQKQKRNAQTKDSVPQKEKKSMPQEVSLPAKRNVSQTDNMSEKSSVSHQELPGKSIASQKDNLPTKTSVPQTCISPGNSNVSVNRNLQEKDKDKTNIKQKPRVQPPKETKKRKKGTPKKKKH